MWRQPPWRRRSPAASATGTTTGPISVGCSGPTRRSGFTQDPWFLGLTFAVPVLAWSPPSCVSWRRPGLLRPARRRRHGPGRGDPPLRGAFGGGCRGSRPSWSTAPSAPRCGPRTGPHPWWCSGWPCSSAAVSPPSPCGKRSAGLAAAVLALALVAAANPAGVERLHRARPLHPALLAAGLRHHRPPMPSTPNTRAPASSPSPARASPPTATATPSTPSGPDC